MDDRDDLRSGLDSVASHVDVGDVVDARSRVDGLVRRRSLRRRAVAGVGAGALLLVGVVAIGAVQSDGADTLVGVEPTTVGPRPDVTDPDAATVTTEPAPASTASPSSAPHASDTAAGRAVEVIDGASLRTMTSGDPASIQPIWAVPWRDGFLVGGNVLPADDGSADVQGEERFDVLYTVDGSTWEAVDMTMPAGASRLTNATAVGDRLVVAYDRDDRNIFQPADDGVDLGVDAITIAGTTDLQDWTTQEIAMPEAEVDAVDGRHPIDLPAFVRRTLGISELVANESGWSVLVRENRAPDVTLLVPPEKMSEIEAAGQPQSSWNDTGFEVHSGSVRFASSWEQAGVDPMVVESLSRPAPTNRFAAAWDGEPRRVDPATGDRLGRVGWTAATTAGFLRWTPDLMWFSGDGLAWTTVPLPDGVTSVAGGFAVDDGAILVAVDDDANSSVYHLDPRGASAERLAIPMPSLTFPGLLSSQDWPRRSGMVLEVSGESSAGTPGDSSSFDGGLTDGLLLASIGADRFVVDALVGIGSADVVVSGDRLLAYSDSGWFAYQPPS